MIMKELEEIMTVPAVRHRFARRVALFGNAIGVANLVLVADRLRSGMHYGEPVTRDGPRPCADLSPGGDSPAALG